MSNPKLNAFVLVKSTDNNLSSNPIVLAVTNMNGRTQNNAPSKSTKVSPKRRANHLSMLATNQVPEAIHATNSTSAPNWYEKTKNIIAHLMAYNQDGPLVLHTIDTSDKRLRLSVCSMRDKIYTQLAILSNSGANRKRLQYWR